jgi:hypothetical protein
VLVDRREQLGVTRWVDSIASAGQHRQLRTGHPQGRSVGTRVDAERATGDDRPALGVRRCDDWIERP